VTSIPLAQPQVRESHEGREREKRRSRPMRWQDVAPSRSDLIEFCRREGLPGEDVGGASFRSIVPRPCHKSGNLYWKPGTNLPPWTTSFACRKFCCSYCAPWMGSILVSDVAESLGVELTPEYAGQIYNGTTSIGSYCQSDPHIDPLFAHWFQDTAEVSFVKDVLQDQAGRRRDKGVAVQYLAAVDHRKGWWVIATAPLWDQTPGRRGRPPKREVTIVPVEAVVGLAWSFGILSSGAAIDKTRSTAWILHSDDDDRGKVASGVIRLGAARTDVGERVGELLWPEHLDRTTSEQDARAISARAIANVKSLLNRGAPCVSCGRKIGEKTAYAFNPLRGLTCEGCAETERQAARDCREQQAALGPSEEELLGDALRGLLIRGPATELQIERHLNGQNWGVWFSCDDDLLRQSLNFVGAVCHPDGRWGLPELGAAAGTQ
jgi:hypothetical protein